MQTNFLGKNGFTWWIGIIANRADPLGLGRCQVRIFGYHGDFTDPVTGLVSPTKPAVQNIPTETLPWALAMYPLNNSKSFSAPMLGDWVVGFFLDGESAQAPVMMGVLPGYNQIVDPPADTPPVGRSANNADVGAEDTNNNSGDSAVDTSADA